VAITVVLAAVLYVLISGLTHGAGSAPLGTNFGYGSPINDTGVKTLGCGVTVGAYCYGIEINTGGSLGITNFILSLKNPTGSTVAWPTAIAATPITAPAGLTTGTPTAASIALISPTTAAAVAYYSTTSSSWYAIGTFSGTITSGSSIVLYFSTAGGAGLLGDQLVAVGSSGYSGTVPSSTFS